MTVNPQKPRGLIPLLVFAGVLLLIACTRTEALPPQAATTKPSPAPPTATGAPAPTATSSPMQTPAATAAPSPAPSPTPTRAPAQKTPAPPVDSATSPFSPIEPEFVVRGDPASGRIALTFDQGLKDPGTTGKLLDLLRQHNIQATFFLTGEWTAANPELAGRIVSDGHEVGNHTYDHANLTEVSPEEMRSQLGRTYAVLKDLGIDDALRPYFRAPFGATDQAVLQTAADEGYRTIHWTLDSGDWRPEMSAQDVIDRLTAEAKPGDIIVAHGYSAKTYDAFSAAIPFLLGKGYALGSLSALLGP